MAFSSRLLSAVISSVRSPSTSSPDGWSTLISMPADSADRRDRASASSTSSSTSTARQLGQPLRAREPGQRDQLGDQRAEPRRLLEDPAGEAAHLGGVVRGVEHGLGQQPHRADGRLELVADVRDEVAPGGLQPHGVRAVGGLDHGEPVAEPADLPEHGGGLAATALQRRQVDLDRRSVGRAVRHLPAGRPGARIGDAAADDAELDRAAGCAAPPRRPRSARRARHPTSGTPAAAGRPASGPGRRRGRHAPHGAVRTSGRGPGPARIHRRGRPAARPRPARPTPADSRPHRRRAARQDRAVVIPATTTRKIFRPAFTRRSPVARADLRFNIVEASCFSWHTGCRTTTTGGSRAHPAPQPRRALRPRRRRERGLLHRGPGLPGQGRTARGGVPAGRGLDQRPRPRPVRRRRAGPAPRRPGAAPSGSTTSPGRSTPSPSCAASPRSWPSAAPWSARRTTARPRRSTPTTPTAWSSR